MTQTFTINTELLPQASMPEGAMHSQRRLQDALGTLSASQQALIAASAGNSEFLARLLAQQPEQFAHFCNHGARSAFAHAMQALEESYADRTTLMQQLRIAKQRIALSIALADITQHFSANEVTRHLTRFADEAVRIACRSLLLMAHRKGTIVLPNTDDPLDASGLLVLAMGKMGAKELNYSSDIDLMLLFEPDRFDYKGRQNLQHFFTKLAQDLCDILQQRTADGYVFRTDLRLRPDPRSTPPAVNLNSAITYYESVGQNWERAAMIKARPIAADAQTAARFAQAMEAFIWRRHLDFAAIADINSIKRQIDAQSGAPLEFSGHHVKLGRGGIREIEFFTQTQQLIWGGRDSGLRQRRTIDALQALRDATHISAHICEQLCHAYWYLRRVEHHIQMLDDQQTHSIPEAEEMRNRLACFLGYPTLQAFEAECMQICASVHQIYADSMASTPPLSLGGNLVFTGVEHDPATLNTLSKLGFSNTQWVSRQIQQWHHGHRRATRSQKARQLLTELTPALLKAFSQTADANDAFKRFDEFLAQVPVGVQIFSLLGANQQVLQDLALILGSAPALGDSLTRMPSLLDFLLERDSNLPALENLAGLLTKYLHPCEDYEQALRALRQFKQEMQFRVGVKLLQNTINTNCCMQYLSELSTLCLNQALRLCLHDYSHKEPTPEHFDFAILALGKAGTQELTFDSDLDLIFLFSGSNSVFAQRFAARLCNALTLRSKEGQLYEIDLRLRPGGNSAPLATSIERFEDYFKQDGWDVEALALTRARIIYSSSDAFKGRITSALHALLDTRFNSQKLIASIMQLRQKIAQQHTTQDPWNIKFVAGGLMDISLIAQYYRLTQPQLFSHHFGQPCDVIFTQLAEHRLIEKNAAQQLIAAYRLQRHMQHILRLCSIKQTIDKHSTVSIQSLVASLMNTTDCTTLKQALHEAQADTLRHLQTLSQQ